MVKPYHLPLQHQRGFVRIGAISVEIRLLRCRIGRFLELPSDLLHFLQHLQNGLVSHELVSALLSSEADPFMLLFGDEASALHADPNGLLLGVQSGKSEGCTDMPSAERRPEEMHAEGDGEVTGR
ncbi:hypothetical protein Mapa_008387 [Marchantia paleacea]|nr:hypothetical protein Mapa_008387 [Marchantia paleacea]